MDTSHVRTPFLLREVTQWVHLGKEPLLPYGSGLWFPMLPASWGLGSRRLQRSPTLNVDRTTEE